VEALTIPGWAWAFGAYLFTASHVAAWWVIRQQWKTDLRLQAIELHITGENSGRERNRIQRRQSTARVVGDAGRPLPDHGYL
jgi:hypothetical protein